MGCKMSTGVSSPMHADVVHVDAPEELVRKFCLKPDAPDHRDFILNVARHSKVEDEELPTSVDLRPKEGFAIYQQGNLGSCTANAIAAAYHYQLLIQGLNEFCPSRLFVYFLEREIMGTITEDSGASLRSGMLAISRFGVCDEKTWPYDTNEFTKQPSPESYFDAVDNRCKKYARVQQDLESLKGCLVAGFPFVFGFVVYSSFMKETQKDGKMSAEPSGDRLGGHAVQACGYDDEMECFIVRNSWGSAWGDKGYFYMPYSYIANTELAMDFWAIKWVEHAEFPLVDEADVRGPCHKWKECFDC